MRGTAHVAADTLDSTGAGPFLVSPSPGYDHCMRNYMPIWAAWYWVAGDVRCCDSGAPPALDRPTTGVQRPMANERGRSAEYGAPRFGADGPGPAAFRAAGWSGGADLLQEGQHVEVVAARFDLPVVIFEDECGGRLLSLSGRWNRALWRRQLAWCGCLPK